MLDLRQRTISGIAWSLIAQIGRQGSIFLVSIVLARILTPREFGLMAMVTVIVGFATIFSEMGLGSAIIQKQTIDQYQLSSVFWLNVLVGVMLTFIFIALSPLVAEFYGEPILIPLTIIVSLGFSISSINIIQRTLLVKSMNFRSLSFVEITSAVAAGSIAIILALIGYGVWSLAAQSILMALITAILLWLRSDWKPTFSFQWKSVKELLGFSTNLLGTQTLNYSVRNIDYVLIGRVLGSDPLGIYTRAYSIMLFPLANISRVLSRVMFPSFSMIQEDKKKIRRLYLKISRSVALITFPMMLGLFVVAESFVVAIFGSNWVEMIPILRILCIVGLMQSVVTLNGNIYMSQGRTDTQFRVGIILRLNNIIGIVIGLQWGLIGVAIGYAIAVTINVIPNFYFAGRLIDLRIYKILLNFSSILGCSLTMAVASWLIAFAIPESWSDIALLIVQASFGVVVYGLLVHLLRLDAYSELRTLIIDQWNLRRRDVVSA